MIESSTAKLQTINNQEIQTPRKITLPAVYRQQLYTTKWIITSQDLTLYIL